MKWKMCKASQVALKLQSNILITSVSIPPPLPIHTSRYYTWAHVHTHTRTYTHTCSAEREVTWRRHLQEFLLLLLDRGEDMRLVDESRWALNDGMCRESTHSTTLLPLILTHTLADRHTHTFRQEAMLWREVLSEMACLSVCVCVKCSGCLIDWEANLRVCSSWEHTTQDDGGGDERREVWRERKETRRQRSTEQRRERRGKGTDETSQRFRGEMEKEEWRRERGKET